MLTHVFHVRLPGIDASLDQLVALVECGEIDVVSVPLMEVVGQYRRHLHTRETADIVVLADGVAAVARLMVLKSAALLPRPPAVVPEQDSAGDRSLELAALIQEYRRFKAAAEEFRGREQEGLRSFPRLSPAPLLPPSLGLSNVTLDGLLAIVQEALRRRPPDPPADVPRHTVTVRERLAALEAELATAGRVSFRGFIAACRTRIEIIVGFMAVLELIKSGRAAAEQDEPFGDILIVAQALVATTVD